MISELFENVTAGVFIIIFAGALQKVYKIKHSQMPCIKFRVIVSDTKLSMYML